jgi:hypothetical protein
MASAKLHPRITNSGAAAAVFALFLAGCSGNDLGAEVSGRVTLDGQPVGPGTVVFQPAGGQSNPPQGTVQVDGSYFMRTNQTVGLAPGKYKAGVAIYDPPDLKPGERASKPSELLSPERYAQPDTSGLEYDVTPGDNTIDIKLTTQ